MQLFPNIILFRLEKNTFIGCDFNEHVGTSRNIFDSVYKEFGFGERNKISGFARSCTNSKIVPGEHIVPDVGS